MDRDPSAADRPIDRATNNGIGLKSYHLAIFSVAAVKHIVGRVAPAWERKPGRVFHRRCDTQPMKTVLLCLATIAALKAIKYLAECVWEIM